MKDLMWGKCSLAIAKKTAGQYGEWKAFPAPVDASTTLTTTKGEKKEAKVEGGGVEAVKYGSNTYSLASSFRRGMVDGQPVSFPFTDVDGVVDGVYGFRLQPENKEVTGMFVKEVIISTEDTYTSADGAIKVVTFDFIKPETISTESPEPTINWELIPDLLAAVKEKEQVASVS